MKKAILDIQLQKKLDSAYPGINTTGDFFYENHENGVEIICNKLQIIPPFQRIRSPLFKSIGFALLAAVNAGLLIFLALNTTPLFSLLGLFAGVAVLSMLLVQLVVGAYQATTYARQVYQNAQISQAVTICNGFLNEQERLNVIKALAVKIREDNTDYEWDENDLHKKLNQQFEENYDLKNEIALRNKDLETLWINIYKLEDEIAKGQQEIRELKQKIQKLEQDQTRSLGDVLKCFS